MQKMFKNIKWSSNSDFLINNLNFKFYFFEKYLDIEIKVN